MNFWKQCLFSAVPWVVVAVLSCGMTLLVLCPAAWITPHFAKATRGHINLIAPIGSLWEGSAVLMLAAGADTQAATLLPGRIQWRTAFWPLFMGRVDMRIQQTDAMPEPVTLNVSMRRASLSAGSMTAPAALLSGLGAPFNTLDLQGGVQLTWTEWRVFGPHAFGQLVITLSNMSSRVSLVKPLGSYQVMLQAQGGSTTLDLSTLKGSLLLNAHATFGTGPTFFQGQADATPDARANLAGLLNLLGRPLGNGAVSLDFTR